MYYLRHSKDFGNIMAARVDNDTAGKMIAGSKGKWVEKNFKHGGKVTVFVFDEDYGFTLGGGRFTTEVQLMIWTGSYLEPCS